MLSKVWKKFKDWSGWSEAGSIVNARITAVLGFITAVIGALDWSPLLSLGIDTGINWVQVAFVGGLMFVKGVLDEIVRRYRAVDL